MGLTMRLYRAFHNVLWDYKNLLRETVGHVFTKPVQIEGITQNFLFPESFFHRSSHFCR
jgi:hypothetical protein